MALADFGQRLADDQVQVNRVLVRRKQLVVQRQDQVPHLFADGLEIGFGFPQQVRGPLVGAERMAELARVLLRTEPPVGRALGQIVRQVLAERPQRRDGQHRSLVVAQAQIGRSARPQRTVDQLDVAFVFLPRHRGPDLGRIGQVLPGLFEERRQPLQARDDGPVARGFGRVLEHKRAEQRVAQQLDVKSRLVPPVLDGVEFEQRQRHLVLHHRVVGLIFRRETGDVEPVQAHVDVAVEAPLALDARFAPVVELLVQRDAAVLVIAGGGGACRRQRQAAVDELLGQRRKLPGRLLRGTPGQTHHSQNRQ